MKKILLGFVILLSTSCAFGQDDPNTLCVGVDELVFIPKPGSCRDLYQCVNGVAVPRTCPDNLWFNPINKACTYPGWSNCTEEGSGDVMSTTEQPLELCPSDDLTFLPHSDSCSKYFVCAGLDSDLVEMECYEDFQFSPTLLQCVPADVAECSVEDGVCPGDLVDGEMVYVPHPSNCSAYYVCLNGQEHEFSCAPGFVWNSVADSCDYAANVICSVI